MKFNFPDFSLKSFPFISTVPASVSHSAATSCDGLVIRQLGIPVIFQVSSGFPCSV